MPVTDTPTASSPTSRFAFLDALRGLAAISIVGFHLYRHEPLPQNSRRFVPFLIEQWLFNGWIGVQFLLVISGFVIAYSFRDGRVTGGSVANFLVRRVVRLSPPYLVTLLLILLLHGIAVLLGWFPSPLDEPPSWGRVASHLIYAQDLLGYPNLSAGLWSSVWRRWRRPCITDDRRSSTRTGDHSSRAGSSRGDWLRSRSPSARTARAGRSTT